MSSSENYVFSAQQNKILFRKTKYETDSFFDCICTSACRTYFLLYTSDDADDPQREDQDGQRRMKNKNTKAQRQ